MKDYQDIILRNYPTDERMGFFVKPNIPSGKLGKVLNDFTRLSPGDVIAVHVYGGVFGSGSVAITAKACYYDKAYFNFEDLRGAEARENMVVADVNQSGSSSTHNIKTDSADAAKVFARFLDTIAAQPKADDVMPDKKDYSKFSTTSLDWLELRDEVMRTIDMLHDRFQAGKIGLTEFEEKKADLLSRL